MSIYNERTMVISSETGEILEEREPGARDKTQKQAELDKKQMNIRKANDELKLQPFSLFRSGSADRLADELTRLELKLLFKLTSHYLNFDSSMLTTNARPSGDPVTIKYLCSNLLGDDGKPIYAEQTLRNLFSSLYKKNVIGKTSVIINQEEIKYYIINPWIVSVGTNINESLYTAFYNSPWRQYATQFKRPSV